MIELLLAVAIAQAATPTKTVPIPGPRVTRTHTPTRTITATATRTPSPNATGVVFERRNAEVLRDLRMKARWYANPVIETFTRNGKNGIRLRGRNLRGTPIAIERPRR